MGVDSDTISGRYFEKVDISNTAQSFETSSALTRSFSERIDGGIVGSSKGLDIKIKMIGLTPALIRTGLERDHKQEPMIL